MWGLVAHILDEPAMRHCQPCEVAWVSTDSKCWVCGQRGEPGPVKTKTVAGSWSFDPRHLIQNMPNPIYPPRAGTTA